MQEKKIAKNKKKRNGEEKIVRQVINLYLQISLQTPTFRYIQDKKN